MSCPAHALAVSRRFLEWEDVDLIRQLIRGMRRKEIYVADLGAGSGTTALSCFAERATGISVLTIDTDPQALASTGEAIKNIGRSDDWLAMQGNAAALGKLMVLKFDLVLLDTSHEYEATCEELTNWLPNLRLKGPRLVWCHDYRGYPGVTQAVNEFIQAGKLKQIDVRGLGWAGKAI